MRPRAWTGRFTTLLAALLLAAAAAPAGVPFTARWSPRNHERPKRATTTYIILHTTEGPTQGSLQKLYDNGEAHFLVDPAGRIYGIIDRRRVAFHSGRSMWRGRTSLDDVSIGIEVAGYCTRDITAAQYQSLRALLTELQTQYDIPDVNVLTHSMVAYGAPNRWFRRSHRGRKRCGMNFAAPASRQRLGLTDQPRYDPDVRAGRLTVGDPYLAHMLYGRLGKAPAPAFTPSLPPPVTHRPATAAATSVTSVTTAVAPRPPGAPPETPAPPPPESAPDAFVLGPNRSAWDIAGDRYNDASTRYRFPDGQETTGDRVRDWKQIPPGTRVIISGEERENANERIQRIGTDGATAHEIAGDEAADGRTVYFLPNGMVRTGAELGEAGVTALPAGTGVLVGYTPGGYLSAKRAAFDVCGPLWNHPSTYYRLPDGTLITGDRVKPTIIPRGTMVFFRN